MRKSVFLAATLLASSMAQADASFSNVPFYALSVSADGQIATGVGASSAIPVWSAATGATTLIATGQAGPSPAVSADGDRVAGTFNVNGHRYAGYYSLSAGQWTTAPGLSTAGTSHGQAFAISGNGQFVAGYSSINGLTPQSNLHATLWTMAAGTATDLGAATNDFTTIYALSYDGKVAVGRAPFGTGVVWTDFDGDGNYARTNLTGVGVSWVVSGDGHWAAGTSGPNNSAYMYNTVTQQYSVLPKVNSSFSSTPTYLSADGSTVLGYELSATGARTGFIWRAGMGIMSMDAFLAEQGVDLNDSFAFRVPASMSADGSTIVGYGTVNGTVGDIGFVVQNLAPVPEPSTYAMLALGLGAVGFVARRRRAAAA